MRLATFAIFPVIVLESAVARDSAFPFRASSSSLSFFATSYAWTCVFHGVRFIVVGLGLESVERECGGHGVHIEAPFDRERRDGFVPDRWGRRANGARKPGRGGPRRALVRPRGPLGGAWSWDAKRSRAGFPNCGRCENVSGFKLGCSVTVSILGVRGNRGPGAGGVPAHGALGGGRGQLHHRTRHGR